MAATQEELIALSEEYLKNTDWIAIKESDTGIAMDPMVKQRRAEARTYIGVTAQSLAVTENIVPIFYNVSETYETAINALFDMKTAAQEAAVV